jgi:hypothetical protein
MQEERTAWTARFAERLCYTPEPSRRQGFSSSCRHAGPPEQAGNRASLVIQLAEQRQAFLVPGACRRFVPLRNRDVCQVREDIGDVSLLSQLSNECQSFFQQRPRGGRIALVKRYLSHQIKPTG